MVVIANINISGTFSIGPVFLLEKKKEEEVVLLLVEPVSFVTKII